MMPTIEEQQRIQIGELERQVADLKEDFAKRMQAGKDAGAIDAGVRNDLLRKLKSAQAEVKELQEQLKAACSEIATDDLLLLERNHLLQTIPACPEHGDQCVPHAVEWVRKALAALSKREPQALIIGQLLEERQRQDAKWGADRNLNDMHWLTILEEEKGEAAKAILEDTPNLRTELVQCAAVTFAWLECIDHRAAILHPKDRNEPPAPSEDLVRARRR